MSNQTTVTPAKLPEAGEQTNSGATVTVACKLPNGLICEVGAIGDDNHKVVRLKGSNDATIVGGYGLTPVSKNFWDAWYSTHKHLAFVRKGFVFIHGTLASAESEAKERADVKNGFEAVNPMESIKARDGSVLLEADLNHYNQAKQDVAQARQASRR